MDAYYRSMTNRSLPAMSPSDAQSMAIGAIYNIMNYIQIANRTAAFNFFSVQFKYFMSILTEEQKKNVRANLKF